jgi:SAM-dependent methyltransferase
VVRVDEVGVICLSDNDGRWEVQPELDRLVRHATSLDEVTAAMAEDNPFLPPALQRQLLHPSGGVAASLVPARPGVMALDLATGWNTLPSALKSLGATVVCADWVYSRLRFSQLINEGASDLTVHLESYEHLPWPSASFDFVFVDLSNLDRLMGPASRNETLSEIHRVLTDSGVAVLGTQNPLRRPRDRAASGGARSSERHLRVRALVTGASRPWRPRALSSAGFGDLRSFAALPRRQGWKELVPEEQLRNRHLERATSHSVKDVIRRCVILLGGAKWLAADFFVIARCGTGQGGPRTLCESLPELEADRPLSVMALSDARVAVVGSRDFVKFPLSLDQQMSLVTEVENTLQARTTEFRPNVVPYGTIKTWHAIPYSTFPRIDSASGVPRAAIEHAVLDALTRLNGGHLASLDTTAFWRRLTSERGRDDSIDLEAVPLRDAVLERLGRAAVPVGPTHGDLHAANLLVTPSGESFLVDWNRFERFNPLILDATYAALVTHRAATGDSLARALAAFIDGGMADPFAEHANKLLGDLLPLHAATITLLDRVVSYSRPRRLYKPWTMPPLREASLALMDRLVDW